MKYIHILLFFLVSITSGYSQQLNVDSINILESIIIDNDTLPNYNISEINVYPIKEFKNKRQKRKYSRLIYNVKKAYPLALIAKNELKIMNDSLSLLDNDKARKKFIKHYEKEMFLKYESKLRKLTFSQGRILIKLVFRELGNTSYSLVKEYRGSFSAVFWQGIARIFGSNLKSTYDPTGEDAKIEHIVKMIEAGII